MPSPLHSGFARFIEHTIQTWLKVTGRKVKLSAHPWLDAPLFPDYSMGEEVYPWVAEKNGFSLHPNIPGAGLTPDFNALANPDFDPALVQPLVRDFYEHTSDYRVEVWAKWKGPFSWFARLLIGSVSPDIQQLNLPLDPMALSRGLESQIIQLAEKGSGEHRYSGWFRRMKSTNQVVFAGFYTVATAPGTRTACVKGVFPLPGGYANVLLQPVLEPDGSFSLVSKGERFGCPGYYRVHRLKNGRATVRYLPLHERIHLFTDSEGTLRTDHTLSFFGFQFLHLHYKMFRKLSS